jgi:hypothetical protein
MRRFSTFAALTLLAAPVFAQTAAKPNFSGKWMQIVDSSAAPTTGRGRMGAGMLMALGPEATIVQDSATITITRSVPQMGEMKSGYKLDGSDTPASLDIQGFAIQTVSNAKWEGEKLALTTRVDYNGTGLSSSATLSLEAGVLVVTTTVPNLQGGAPTSTTMKYKKG